MNKTSKKELPTLSLPPGLTKAVNAPPRSKAALAEPDNLAFADPNTMKRMRKLEREALKPKPQPHAV